MSRERGIKIKYKEQKQRISLMLTFSLIVFSIIFAAIVSAVGLAYLFYYLGWIGSIEGQPNVRGVFVFVIGFSLVLGSAIAFFSSRIPLEPVNLLINKMNCLAAGNFEERLEFKGALSSHSVFKEISTSFNKMAEQLENTEIFRSDFINSFSHEFKTPIVSISGFAKLVNKGDLTEEQRAQYLTAIEEESLRLSTMATNVLTLSKVESQTILTDVSHYNVSEQIRSAVLLLESKWTKKSIDLYLDFDEYEIEANEEMLKHVWINLIDNAIKFSPAGGTVAVNISENEQGICVYVSNNGADIPEEKLDKIFNKFYQADESHAAEGNGVGLAIVERAVKLHRGDVSVKCADGVVTFTVLLPKEVGELLA